MVRITGKDAECLLAAYAKVHAPKEEPKTEEPTAETTPPDESSENNK